jgi:type I restriction enzyme M protein
LFRKEEHEIRKNLIEKDLIEAVIGLGPNLFFNAPMEACVLVCRSHKPAELKNKIIFINAVKEVTRKNAESYLEPTHIEKITSAYFGINDIPQFCSIVSVDQISENDYSLSIPLYANAFENDNQVYIISTTEALGQWNSKHSDTITALNELITLIEQ